MSSALQVRGSGLKVRGFSLLCPHGRINALREATIMQRPLWRSLSWPYWSHLSLTQKLQLPLTMVKLPSVAKVDQSFIS